MGSGRDGARPGRLGLIDQAAPRLRDFSAQPPRLIVIGASAGGVDAVGAALASLGHFSDLPAVIALHIGSAWAPIIARQAGRASTRVCVIANDGDIVRPGLAYFAAGGRDLRLLRLAAGIACRHGESLPDAPSPSVDVLFRSAADALGSAVVGVVLSGMGEDGLRGAEAIVAAGGSVVVQDQRSSAVWGMPGAVATAGLASAIVPAAAIGATLHRHLSGLARPASHGATPVADTSESDARGWDGAADSSNSGRGRS